VSLRGPIGVPAFLALVLHGWCAPPPSSAASLACQARASYEQSPPPLSVTFGAMAAGGTGQYQFEWVFGDGGSSTQQDPSHTYTQPGIYSAVVTVTDAGSQETCRDTALVFAGVVADPACAATASIRWGDAPLPVAFDAYPVFAGGGESDTWTWRFGDGEFSAEQSPPHVYSEPGTYWAVATLHTPNGSYDCFPTLRVSALTPGSNSGVDAGVRDGGLRLEPARPNPFGVMTVIAFDLPRPGHTRLAILDVGGRTVAELVNGFRPAGWAISIWQGRAATGPVAPPGLYFARLEHDGVMRSTRIVRMR